MPSGAILAYFRYTLADGKRDTLPIGQFSESGRDGLTLTEARTKAGELSRIYQAGTKNIRAHLDAEETAKKAAQDAVKVAAETALRAAEIRRHYTLRALCDVYTTTLDRTGKTKSAKDARSTFKVHVFEAHADIAETSAREITSHQVAAMIRLVRETGKERTAGILRSYLRAAYGAAIRAPFDSSLPADFIPFNIESNPVDAIPTVPINAGHRTLSAAELGVYIQSLGDNIIDQALKLALLSGGQRMAQLLRTQVNDYDAANQTLRLWDGKGRRRTAREHLLPLGPAAIVLVEQLIQRAYLKSNTKTEDHGINGNPYLFISTGGALVADTTPGKRVADIAAEMKGESFNLRDIRRTVETMLAGLGINRETRAQLLSHGLSGVQNVHYDRHTYLDEKHAALVTWEHHLDAIHNGKVSAGNGRNGHRQNSAG